MKIGILTLMNGYNYGGILQCASLYRILTGMGHDVIVIDYPKSAKLRRIRRYLSLLGAPMAHLVLDKLRSYRYGKTVHDKFEAFRRNMLSLSKPCNTIEDLKRQVSHFDAVVVGSDQVWNRFMGIPEYFLGFAPDYPGRKFSYAACFGAYFSPAERWPMVGKWLADFDRIGVRNEMSRKLVKELCGRDSEVVVDPTLLCDLDDLAVRFDSPFERYILLYGLSAERMRSAGEVLARVRKTLGIPLVGISSSGLQAWLPECVDYVANNPGVEEWLGLIRGAEFIATDSFHGMLYAIKNEKQFFSFIGRSRGEERVSYVVERYAVQAGRPADLANALVGEINYGKTTPLVAEHVEQSMTYLKSLFESEGATHEAGRRSSGASRC